MARAPARRARTWPPGRPDRRALEPALSAVTAQAAWEIKDLVARRGEGLAPDLLRGRTAELSGSPLARDLVLALVLDRAADAIAKDDPPDLSGREYLARVPIAAEDAAEILEMAAELKDQKKARDVAERLARSYRKAADGAVLSAGEALRQDATLNAAFWADRRLTASKPLRALMLACIPHLDSEAEGLARPAGLRKKIASFLDGLSPR